MWLGLPTTRRLGLVFARIALRIGIGLVLAGEALIACVGHRAAIPHDRSRRNVDGGPVTRCQCGRQLSGCTAECELGYTSSMVEHRTRGYFGIGAEGLSKSANVGALLRTGHAFGAAFCFTIGTGWDSRASRTADTADTPSHVPMWRYPSALTERVVAARSAPWWGSNGSTMRSICPPSVIRLNAAYVLGPERAGLSAALLERCDHVVRIPTRFSPST